MYGSLKMSSHTDLNYNIPHYERIFIPK